MTPREKQISNNLSSIARLGLVMGVVHFSFQPQEVLYVSLQPSLQLHLHQGHSQGRGIAQYRFRDGIELSHTHKNVVFSYKKKKTFLKVENITCGRSNDNLPRLNEQDTDKMHSFVEMNT